MKQPKTIIIGLAGKKGAGKDYTADVIQSVCENHSLTVYRTSFAEPVKNMLSIGLSVDMDCFVDHDKKEKVIPHVGCTPRKLMQTLGTGWGRNLVSENLWADLCKYRIETKIEKRINIVLVTDVRHTNEAQVIKNLGGIIIDVQATDKTALDMHSSEARISSDLVTTVFINNKLPRYRPSVVKYIAELLVKNEVV
ncbi:hypothetical protein AD45P2_00435 [Alteromonas phage vB_AmaP_AD45-P2]|uniref:Deoxynucleotide monophosphate kinase n=1 Tax=Pseudorhizobium pelagicum TaxID=1509405 RepID=A0A922NZ18_9HYPH|nr:hypothetical protein [Pseudorhizobium pelagicum]YP_008126057.1 hypothetical protein M610_gp095 [Alteromonas phage vB_AmaP_AD45-P1]AGM47020.1 hypothetical protein AD45P3_00410 [Alteromonas phage vB_AmaP_AD45-P3]AGM47136.1 hypothetical protein AD45P4_00405 [Alteromonas phage vB_AmaP_AD45-P4]AGM47258.1 hypothetical protein AD45P2_00435 [Alteromonas phage vB_AmaP_AD45-P2]AGM46904.1 hypothetical protein AD45P1_00430 [Alteromonas phage vB_AmaP_AD45-P1]KEQ05622.1 hypothetical protein GV68_08825 [